MQVSPSALFKKCYCNYAIPAINIWGMEQILALFSAAQKAKAPFIVQMTPVAIKYGGMNMLLSMISSAAMEYPETVYAVHLDHGDMENVFRCIESDAYNSVMFDGSHNSFELNISSTREVVEKAHARNIAVEAELGVLSGIEDDKVVDEKDTKYTRASEVEDFVSRTGCDSLAVAVGTSHGAYKFSGDQSIQFHILEEIQRRLPGFPLVLHGGSGIHSEEIRRINSAGGQIGSDARGVSSHDIRRAIKLGICKVNIATDARIIWTRVHREFFSQSPTEFDPIIPGRKYIRELEEFYTDKFNLFGASNKTVDIES